VNTERLPQLNKPLALDAMGGDHAPAMVLEAAALLLRESPELELVLVGPEDQLEPLLESHGLAGEARLSLRHAPEVVAMDELPAQALRGKKRSSMRIAIEMVQSGEAAAAVSAGNTGALMATAKFVLKTLPGIERPAICAAMPSTGEPTWMLDLGANVECDAEHLQQFALMGSTLAEAVSGINRPRVGLLNVGAEAIKGNEVVKAAAERLAASPLNYIGFVEGDELFTGRAHVIVADGFVGNVALKASEGTAKVIGGFMKEAFGRNALSKLAGLVAWPVLQGLKHRIDPRRYNGASFLGLNGVVVKSHGGADALAFAQAVRVAQRTAAQAVPSRISEQLDALLLSRPET